MDSKSGSTSIMLITYFLLSLHFSTWTLPFLCTHEKIPTSSLNPQTWMWGRRISFPCFCRRGHIGCTGTCTISVHPYRVLSDHQWSTCCITSYNSILLKPEKRCPAVTAPYPIIAGLSMDWLFRSTHDAKNGELQHNILPFREYA